MAPAQPPSDADEEADSDRKPQVGTPGATLNVNCSDDRDTSLIAKALCEGQTAATLESP